MLLCDDEPSPVSSDEVFFICEKQTSVERDAQRDNCSENESSGNRSDCEEAKRAKTTSKSKLCRSRGKKIALEGGKEAAELEESRANGKDAKEAESQTGHTILVKIQVENCSQCPEKSISLFSHEPPGSNKENPCRMKNKTVAVQVNFNSIESVVESHCVKISKVRCCNKASLLQSVGRVNNRCAEQAASEKSDNRSSADSTKIYLWSGKSLKKKPAARSKSVAEKPKPPPPPPPPPPPTIREPAAVQRSNSCVEKSSAKSKKSTGPGCSPLGKLNRSSLTIEPDRITINLSKYSPCASRLAASSKILSGSSQLSPDSPLHGATSQPSPSPRRLDHARSVDRAAGRQPADKTTLQASLSLNIQQFQKSHPAPRSRSVGDSCVTSPTSEATTLSYSPTGTEILSLEEVGGGPPQSSFNDPAAATVLVLPPPPPPELKYHHEYSVCARNANLETKC